MLIYMYFSSFDHLQTVNVKTCRKKILYSYHQLFSDVANFLIAYRNRVWGNSRALFCPPPRMFFWQTFIKYFCQTLSMTDGNSWVVTDFEKVLQEPFSRVHCILPMAVPCLWLFIVSMHNLLRQLAERGRENEKALIWENRLCLKFSKYTCEKSMFKILKTPRLWTQQSIICLMYFTSENQYCKLW